MLTIESKRASRTPVRFRAIRAQSGQSSQFAFSAPPSAPLRASRESTRACELIHHLGRGFPRIRVRERRAQNIPVAYHPKFPISHAEGNGVRGGLRARTEFSAFPPASLDLTRSRGGGSACTSASPRLRVRPFFLGDGDRVRGRNVTHVNGAMVYIVNVLSVSI